MKSIINPEHNQQHEQQHQQQQQEEQGQYRSHDVDDTEGEIVVSADDVHVHSRKNCRNEDGKLVMKTKGSDHPSLLGAVTSISSFEGGHETTIMNSTSIGSSNQPASPPATSTASSNSIASNNNNNNNNDDNNRSGGGNAKFPGTASLRGAAVAPNVVVPPSSKGKTLIMNSTSPLSSSNGNSIGGGTSGSSAMSMMKKNYNKSLPPLFLFIESGDLRRAAERARHHPREVKTWATIPMKSSSSGPVGQRQGTTTKRLALHQACFKLRAASGNSGSHSTEDPFIEVCRFILLLVEIYPEAAGMRESRHGCLPLHLAAFASCIRPPNSSGQTEPATPTTSNNNSNNNNASFAISPSSFSVSSMSSALPSPMGGCNNHTLGSSTARGQLPRPGTIALRSASESTADTLQTTMSAALAEEEYAGFQTDYQNEKRQASTLTISTSETMGIGVTTAAHAAAATAQSVSIGSNIFISEKREEWAVKVLNALLDAFPRASRMDSEGGRLPLHTASAGRATPRVVATLVTAYPAAARHRNKDGYLPLHLSAHWGISHPQVAVTLLKAYPDATFGRNRWERTPLEEALCMAGENGRPHQAALVRALRKHPSYWTRPEGVLFQSKSPRDGYQIVDVDETLPSNEDDSMDDDELFFDSAPNYDSRNGQSRFRRNRDHTEGVEAASPVLNDLPTLIRSQSWEGVLQRLRMNPTDARMCLMVSTKGGFTSTTDFYPLHYACERRPPVEIVQALIKLCPEALSKRTMPGGALPLHIAATWYAPEDVIDALLAADRNACKTHDELGNLPIHSACFSGTSTSVVESLLKAYPKAILVRNNQGSLPEDITKRLKHDNRVSTLALLNLCRDEVIAKRQQKHRRNRSDGYTPTPKETMILNERDSHVNPEKYLIENFDATLGGVEVTYNGGTTDEDLMWV